MEKGTIIYVGGFIMPDRNAAAHRVTTIGKIFDSLGFHTVFLGRAHENDHFDGVRKSSFSDNVYEICEPASTKEWVKYMFDTSAIETVCKSYDDVKIIILYDMPYLTYMSVRKKFRRKGIRIIYDCAEWSSWTEGNIIKRYYKKLDDFMIRKLLGRSADGIIAISRMMENEYVRSNKNVVRLTPMVDISDSIWNQEKINHGDKFEFCFAGTPGGGKDSIDKVIRAFSKTDNENAVLRIIGVTKSDVYQKYPGFTDEINDERIIFMGRLSHEETIRYVLSCDCYVFIRQQNRKNNAGFPTKFVEACTCGASLITTDTSDIKEYITDHDSVTVLYEISDEDIKEAMIEKMRDNKKSEKYVPDDTFHYLNYKEKTQKWLNGLF